MKTRSIDDATEQQMCVGCGACAYISPNEIEMVDDFEHGRRPVVSRQGAADPRTTEALAVCPGISLTRPEVGPGDRHLRELMPAWGPVLELWEGSATDQDIRFAASSGGAATALSLYCLEHANMAGVLHIRARADVSYLNETTLSRTREEVLRARGSRYSPASPCDGLSLIEEAAAPCVFIGKPCDVAAVEKARRLRPGLDSKVGLTIAIFCAGTPSTNGTLRMLEAMGVQDPASVTEVRYRGLGWPGKAAATFQENGVEVRREMTYEESWGGILQKHRQWRCYLCIDHAGEFADIAVGDPWYRELAEDEVGESLILVRTERGRRILDGAIRAGYLQLKRCQPDVLPRSQGHFIPQRGRIWAQLLVLRLFGAAVPRYVGMPMFRFFLKDLSLGQKIRALLGTVRRVFRRRLRHRVKVKAFTPAGARSPEPERSEKPMASSAGASGRLGGND